MKQFIKFITTIILILNITIAQNDGKDNQQVVVINPGQYQEIYPNFSSLYLEFETKYLDSLLIQMTLLNYTRENSVKVPVSLVQNQEKINLEFNFSPIQTTVEIIYQIHKFEEFCDQVSTNCSFKLEIEDQIIELFKKIDVKVVLGLQAIQKQKINLFLNTISPINLNFINTLTTQNGFQELAVFEQEQQQWNLPIQYRLFAKMEPNTVYHFSTAFNRYDPLDHIMYNIIPDSDLFQQKEFYPNFDEPYYQKQFQRLELYYQKKDQDQNDWNFNSFSDQFQCPNEEPCKIFFSMYIHNNQVNIDELMDRKQNFINDDEYLLKKRVYLHFFKENEIPQLSLDSQNIQMQIQQNQIQNILNTYVVNFEKYEEQEYIYTQIEGCSYFDSQNQQFDKTCGYILEHKRIEKKQKARLSGNYANNLVNIKDKLIKTKDNEENQLILTILNLQMIKNQKQIKSLNENENQEIIFTGVNNFKNEIFYQKFEFQKKIKETIQNNNQDFVNIYEQQNFSVEKYLMFNYKIVDHKSLQQLEINFSSFDDNTIYYLKVFTYDCKQRDNCDFVPDFTQFKQQNEDVLLGINSSKAKKKFTLSFENYDQNVSNIKKGKVGKQKPEIIFFLIQIQSLSDYQKIQNDGEVSEVIQFSEDMERKNNIPMYSLNLSLQEIHRYQYNEKSLFYIFVIVVLVMVILVLIFGARRKILKKLERKKKQQYYDNLE